MPELWSSRGTPKSIPSCAICGAARNAKHDFIAHRWHETAPGSGIFTRQHVMGRNLRLWNSTLHAYVPFDEELP